MGSLQPGRSTAIRSVVVPELTPVLRHSHPAPLTSPFSLAPAAHSCPLSTPALRPGPTLPPQACIPGCVALAVAPGPAQLPRCPGTQQMPEDRGHPTCCQGPTVLEPRVNPDKPKGDTDSESPQTGHEGCTCRPGALRDASPGSRRLVPVLPKGKELREVSGQPKATQHGEGVGGEEARSRPVLLMETPPQRHNSSS